jgi:signal transduction histidine kinase
VSTSAPDLTPATPATANTAAPRATPEELRGIRLLADLADDERAWIAERTAVIELAAGDTLFEAGAPADRMCFAIEGTIEARREQLGAGAPVFTFKTGDTFGVVPFSRMERFGAPGRATTRARIATFPRDEFDALLRRIPRLEHRFAAFLADRVRDSTRREQQFEKLMALGKLSAGLAHELNNPASAARRSASEARRRAADASMHAAEMAAALAEATADPEVRDGWCGAIERMREGAAARPRDPNEDPLDRADREQALGDWLESVGTPAPWDLAPTFADAGITVADLQGVIDPLPEPARASALAWCEAAVATDLLLATVEHATARIAELVNAVKTYTHMDRAMVPSPVDVREGLDITLALFAHKLRDRRVALVRELPPDVPPARGYAGELNQVWTNLVDNAIDAVPAEGGQVSIRLRRDGEQVVVEVEDNGGGVPADVRDRIWEPFFTTKEVGRGTGLGLDIARHIVVEQHGGTIDLDTRPGRTVFTVQLPMSTEQPSPERAVLPDDGAAPAVVAPGAAPLAAAATRAARAAR